MRKSLFLLCALLVSSAAGAQNKTASWQNLNSLATGEKIQVLAMDSKKTSGTFLSVSGAAITVQTDAGPRTIPKQDVRSVKRMKASHRLRNTLIVAGVGAGAGAGIAAGTWEKGGFEGGKGDGAAVGAVIGGLGGAIVGALLPSHDTIYKVSSRGEGP
jgi:hypothetical protein